jgi:hypothetical protein
MAFNQKPGRQSFPKTGHGIPSPLMQTNRMSGAQINSINDWSDSNKNRLALDASAKNDSVTAYNKNIMEGHTKAYAGKMGNKAANETRTKGGAPDMNVYKNTTNPGSKHMDTSAGGDTYFRKGPVEKDAPRITPR